MWGLNDVLTYSVAYGMGEEEGRTKAEREKKASSNWHTGTPTETGLYVVLTEVETIGIHSSKGTYLLDWWDGYFFKNLKDIVQNSPIHRMREYSWVKWQKIEED